MGTSTGRKGAKTFSRATSHSIAVHTHQSRVVTAVNRHLPLHGSTNHVVHFLLNHLKQSIAETMQTLRRIVQDPEFVHVMLVHFRENRVYVAARFRAYTLPPEYPSSGCSE